MPKKKTDKIDSAISDRKETAKEIEKTQSTIKSSEEALQQILAAKEKSKQVFQQEQEKLNEMEGRLTGISEEDKIRLDQENDIRQKQQTLRNKKVDYDLDSMDIKAAARQQQNPNQLSTKDALEQRKFELIYGGNKQNDFMPQFFQMQLQMQDMDDERDMGMIKEIQKIKEDRKDIKDSMKDFNDFQDNIDSALKRGGWIKSEGEQSGWSYLSNTFEKIMPALVELGKKSLDTKQQQQQQFLTPSPPGEIPAGTIPEQNPSLQMPEQSESLIEQEQAPESIQQPAPMPAQMPSDQELMQMPYLHDSSYPNTDYNNSPFLNMYDEINRGTSTAPQSPMVPSP